MWEWLQQGKNLQGLGSMVGSIGNIYGGVKSANAANKMIDLDRQTFDLNKKLLLADEDAKKREKEAYASAYGSGVVAL